MIIKISMKEKEIITSINKKEINIIIITLIKKIKEFLKTKCRFNLKKETIKKKLNIKKSFKNQHL